MAWIPLELVSPLTDSKIGSCPIDLRLPAANFPPAATSPPPSAVAPEISKSPFPNKMWENNPRWDLPSNGRTFSFSFFFHSLDKKKKGGAATFDSGGVASNLLDAWVTHGCWWPAPSGVNRSLNGVITEPRLLPATAIWHHGAEAPPLQPLPCWNSELLFLSLGRFSFFFFTAQSVPGAATVNVVLLPSRPHIFHSQHFSWFDHFCYRVTFLFLPSAAAAPPKPCWSIPMLAPQSLWGQPGRRGQPSSFSSCAPSCIWFQMWGTEEQMK